jgi:hypothetical protein
MASSSASPVVGSAGAATAVACARAAAAATAVAGRGPIGIGAGLPAGLPLPLEATAGWAGPTVPDRSCAGTAWARRASSAVATTRASISCARSGARPAQSRRRLSSRAWAK